MLNAVKRIQVTPTSILAIAETSLSFVSCLLRLDDDMTKFDVIRPYSRPNIPIDAVLDDIKINIYMTDSIRVV